MNQMTLQQAKDQICYHHYGEMYKWHELFPDNKLGLYDEVIELFCQSQKAQAWEEGRSAIFKWRESGSNKIISEKPVNPYLIETKKD